MDKKNYSRRNFIKILGAGSAALSFHPIFASGKYDPAGQPNILFITSDDHALQSISAYGSKINKTPNIDRIADEGMRFNNCLCTNSICAPSRASILTGKYSHKNGMLDNKLEFDGSQETFPKMLQRSGYQSAVVGKWHLKSEPTGFDYWNIFPGQGKYYNPDFIEMGSKKRHHGYATDIVTDLALDWLERRKKQKQFCLVLQYNAPHRNWMPAEKYLTKYDDIEIPLPETFWDDYSTRSDAAREAEMRIADHLFYGLDLKLDPKLDKDENMRALWYRIYNRMDEKQKKAWNTAYGPKNEEFYKADLKGKELIKWKYERFIKDYLRCVDSVDENIGRVLDHLDKNGLAKNTIIVYASDQGFYLGEHGWFDKRFMYEESLHMPLLIRYPEKIKAGSVSNNIVLNLDLAPTFLDYAGFKIPPDMQGKSVRKILDGNTPGNWRNSMYYHYYEYPGWHMVKKHYGIRTERYKLIHFYYDIDAWELYDLEKDPHELNNIYSNPDYSNIISKLKTELAQLQKEYGDTDFLKEIEK